MTYINRKKFRRDKVSDKKVVRNFVAEILESQKVCHAETFGESILYLFFIIIKLFYHNNTIIKGFEMAGIKDVLSIELPPEDPFEDLDFKSFVLVTFCSVNTLEDLLFYHK